MNLSVVQLALLVMFTSFSHMPSHYVYYQEEQVMYPSSLENESFMVALVNCKNETYGLIQGPSLDNSIAWEITRAYKCE